MWFTPNDTLSKQRLFNFVTGPKGDGKTTGCRNYALNQWKKAQADGREFEFAVIRRYKSETQATYKKYFDDINTKFGFDIDMKYRGRTAGVVIDSEEGEIFKPICHFFSLSTDAGIQGVNLPNLQLIIFEEIFLNPRQGKRYLKNEPEQFARMYDTLARPSDPARKRTPVLFIGNSFASSNPYYDFFHVSLNANGEFKSKNIYALHINDKEFSDHAKNTEFGQIMADTAYGKHAFDNDFLLDNFDFVDKNHNKGRLLYNFIYEGKTYGVWANFKNGTMFVSSSYDPSCIRCYAFTTDNMHPNLLTAKMFVNGYQGKLTKFAYNTGCLYFESLSIKNMWFDISRLCNL